jgi:hypothetical protein
LLKADWYLEAYRLQASAKGTIVPLESHPNHAIENGMVDSKVFCFFSFEKKWGAG